MMVRVLVLQGNSTPSPAHLEKWLRDTKYQVEILADFNESLSAIANGEYDILVQAGDCAEAGPLAFIREVQAQHRYFPILQVLSREGYETQKLKSDFFHERVLSSISPRVFLKKLRRMVFLGNLRRRLEGTEYLNARVEHHLGHLKMTSSVEVVQHASELLAELTGSENVIWLSRHYLDQKPDQKEDPKETSQRVLLSQADTFVLKSMHPSSELGVWAQYCHDISGREAEREMPQMWKCEDGTNWVLAVHSQLDGDLLGYLFLVQPRIQPTGFQQVVDKIESQLSYAYTFEATRQLSYIDDLTTLYNQRYLPLVLNQEMSRAQREEKKLSVLFLDVDFFKLVNDTNGHLVGSRVLVQMAELLRNCTRTYDYVFRYGGDEFVVVLPNATVDQAQDVAERIRRQVEISTFVVNGSKVQITVSIGIATFPDHAITAEQVLHLADQAMYYGKNTSRNVVYIASS